MSFSQNCVQRLISLPTLQHAKRFDECKTLTEFIRSTFDAIINYCLSRSMIIFFIGIILLMGINASTGIIMYAFYHGCDPIQSGIKPDRLIPRFVQNVAGDIVPGITGIFISCVFSASLSTVSATLHAMSGIIYNDYIRPFKLFSHTDANANLSMRLIIFLLGTECACGGLLVEQFKSVFQIMITITGTLTGAKFGTFIIGMVYPWANQKV